MTELHMELRSVETSERVVVGRVVPYDEITYLTPDPAGERIRRGAFTRSLAGRHQKVPLLRNHSTERTLGKSRRFTETPDGLVGEFRIHQGRPGDELLADLRDGYLDGLSIGFRTVRSERGQDGVREVADADLIEVSAVALPAYATATVMSVRQARLDALLAPFNKPRPVVDLTPLPLPWR